MGSNRVDPHPGRPIEDVAHRGAWRLTVAFQRSSVQLVLIEAIDMIVPPSLPISGQPPGSPFWFELQDGRGTAVYRRGQLHHPIRPTVEVWTGEPEQPVTNVPFAVDAGEFTLLVPNLPQARAVVLYEWSVAEAGDGRDASPAPSEIARFPIGRAITREAIERDVIPPRTVSDALASYRSVATIHLRASDNTGPVAATHHVLDEHETQQRLTVTTREPGEHVLRFWSVDRAGNVEPEQRVTFVVEPSARQRRA
jgi:hypothetical protein